MFYRASPEVITYGLAVSGVNPTSGSLLGGTTITLQATGLTTDATILIGNVPCSVASVTSSSAECVTHPASTKREVTNGGRHPSNLFSVCYDVYCFVHEFKRKPNLAF